MEVSSFKNTWRYCFPYDEKSYTLSKSAGSVGKLREDHAEADKNLFK